MRPLLRVLFSAVGLLTAAALVPGIHKGTFLELLAVALILGALNATLGAFLKFLAFVPMACSLGCMGLVINGLVFWAAGALATRLGLHFRVDSFWAGFFGALVSSLTAWLLERLLVGRKDTEDPKGGWRRPGKRVKVINE